MPLNAQVKHHVAVSDGRDILLNPWAGGMNACQFGRLDIDMDGVEDLVVFDRCGNRIMPFITPGREENPSLTYHPEYAPRFPELSDWVIFADYNNDGKQDIFTYSPGYAGIKVFRNNSSSTLDFVPEVYPYLTSFQGGGYVNILVTYADYPGICDLDGDGDLDILSFWGLGSFVEMHRNMSVEKYGTPDSLDFIKTSNCWGFFAESEESNVLTLDTCFGSVQSSIFNLQRESRHTGSTFRVLDLNGDGLLDLLLGDVDYPNLVALYNGGNADTARMVSYNWQFPPGNDPVHLFSMPAAFYGDVDRDGTKDLIVSPFDPNPFITDNLNSSWYYRNTGTDSEPQFSLYSRRFLQDEMIDVGAGAYPVFCDYDNDGLADLLIGNYGRYDTSYYDEYMILHTVNKGQLALYRNSGTVSEPAFLGITDDFANLGQLGKTGLVPTFGDLDGDGDDDLVLGNADGALVYCENTAQPGSPMELTLRDEHYQGIDVGDYSSPALFDLDHDGLLDLVIGERGGNLNYYRNSGTSLLAQFELVTDNLGNVNVTDPNLSIYGYSVPFLLRESTDHVQLLVGSEQGKIFYFPDIEGDLGGTFKESDALGPWLGLEDFNPDRGYRTSAAITDLDHDGNRDLVAGNFSGGLEYLSTGGHPAVSGVYEPGYEDVGLVLFPNPASDYIHIETTFPGRYLINRVRICDLAGRTLGDYGFYRQSGVIIDTENYRDGIYLMQVEIFDPYGKVAFLKLKKMLKKNKSK